MLGRAGEASRHFIFLHWSTLAFQITGPGSPEKDELVAEAGGRLPPGTQGFYCQALRPGKNTSKGRIGTRHQFKPVKSEAKLHGKLPRQDSVWQRPQDS